MTSCLGVAVRGPCKSPGSYSWWVEVCLESSAEGNFEFLSGWAHWERLLRLTSDDFCLHGRRGCWGRGWTETRRSCSGEAWGAPWGGVGGPTWA